MISSSPARPLCSTPLHLGGRAANIAAAPLVLEKEGFLSLLPGIVDDICNDPSISDLHPHISEHMEAAIKYNIVGGKMNRGLSVPVSYAVLTPNATQADLEKAAILGWTVEFLQVEQLCDVGSHSPNPRHSFSWRMTSWMAPRLEEDNRAGLENLRLV